MNRLGLSLAVSVAGLAGPAVGGIINVGPGDSIQAAIDAAVDGDEIIVAPGTYNENINFNGKAITLRSSDGPEVTIIDAQGAGSVVTCESGEGEATVLEGFTITGGIGTDPGVQEGNTLGGGMFITGSSPTVTNCIFTGNSVVWGGGGISNNEGSPTVTNCTFSGNTSNFYGGGMLSWNGSPAVINCTFIDNTVSIDDGGGLYNYSGSPTVSNSTFTGNTAFLFGGGMYSRYGNATVSNCTFSGNSAGYGGGMLNGQGPNSNTVVNCTFSGNTADFYGGGMLTGGGSPTVSNCLFVGNTANSSGGGMRN